MYQLCVFAVLKNTQTSLEAILWSDIFTGNTAVTLNYIVVVVKFTSCWKLNLKQRVHGLKSNLIKSVKSEMGLVHKIV